MFGIIVATIIAGWSMFVSGNGAESGFLKAVEFLWVWYWIWTSVLAVIVVLVLFITTGVLTFTGAESFKSKVGGVIGFFAGGALSFLIGIVFVVSRGLLLGGGVSFEDIRNG